jgi:hypothetical protein
LLIDEASTDRKVTPMDKLAQLGAYVEEWVQVRIAEMNASNGSGDSGEAATSDPAESGEPPARKGSQVADQVKGTER